MAIGLTASLALAALAATSARAEPSSLVAWTVETLALVRAGDPSDGEGLAAGCDACHGSDQERAIGAYPNLAGQDAAYLYKQLRDFKDGSRDNGVMRAFASYMSDQDMADVAAYYAGLAAPPVPPPAAPVVEPELARYGDGSRLIPACDSCHGNDGAGNAGYHGMPTLAGQTAQYLTATLLLYDGGYRDNDVYGVMRRIVGSLTTEEIGALSLYYASRDVE